MRQKPLPPPMQTLRLGPQLDVEQSLETIRWGLMIVLCVCLGAGGAVIFVAFCAAALCIWTFWRLINRPVLLVSLTCVIVLARIAGLL